MTDTHYHHRQSGRWLWSLMAVLTLAILLLMSVVARREPGLVWLLGGLCAVNLLIVAAFSSFTIEIDQHELRWRFGGGWFRRRARLADLQDATITRTRWIDGWGIRLTRRGWLYNIVGLDAVLVRRRDGSSFLLGSDEPERLAAAINRGIAQP
ncbi:hypothetical protein [Chitinimonas lacunae]|uniref:PH domain-containing protein n=1 Tax=Chitinimonas lacunae TaxID=1963018 RepID=A0ABV8MS33_9NEIS